MGRTLGRIVRLLRWSLNRAANKTVSGSLTVGVSAGLDYRKKEGNDNPEGRPVCAAAQHGRQASVSAGDDSGCRGGPMCPPSSGNHAERADTWVGPYLFLVLDAKWLNYRGQKSARRAISSEH